MTAMPRACPGAQRGTRGWTRRPYDVRIHETADPGVLVAEYRLEGRKVPDGDLFSLPFVMVLRFRDGPIAASLDYTDPVAGARALGRLPELAATLAKDAAAADLTGNR
jgi:uncharacterized protein